MRKLIVAGLLLMSSQAFASRDYIDIVGSSTVYPFSTTVAEQFGRASKFKTPKVESTGSGGGFKLFCAGVGVKHPDITNSSRRVKASELNRCKKNGVNGVIEVKIGYDGIVLANTKATKQLSLELKDIFLALAKQVPNPKSPESGKLIDNPHVTWSDVRSGLPNTKIEVLGPPPTSGTRDAFVELAMEGGCKQYNWIKKLKKSNKNEYKRICHNIREDGKFVEAGENDNLIVQKLTSNPKAVGIFGYSFLDQNNDKVQGSLISGVSPEFESIAEGKYPVSRPLYFYAKKAHVNSIPGMKEFLKAFTSDKAWGEEGYLSDKGLIPMPEEERKQFAQDVKVLKPLVQL